MEVSSCKAWKIVDYKDGKVRTLFHGCRGSKVIPFNIDIECEEKIVDDGGTKYLSGWHLFLDLEECKKYLPRFKNERRIAECTASGLRRKEHSRNEVYLAKIIKLEKLIDEPER